VAAQPASNEAATVGEVVTLAAQAYGRGQWHTEETPSGPHEAGWLALEVARARTVLGVQARWTLQEAVRRTLHWYRRQAQGAAALTLCQRDVDDFEAAAPRPGSAQRLRTPSPETLVNPGLVVPS
jgi:CDP-glucose 4,6-dehydratase